jgi:hypothetical protein
LAERPRGSPAPPPPPQHTHTPHPQGSFFDTQTGISLKFYATCSGYGIVWIGKVLSQSWHTCVVGTRAMRLRHHIGMDAAIPLTCLAHCTSCSLRLLFFFEPQRAAQYVEDFIPSARKLMAKAEMAGKRRKDGSAVRPSLG